jgi:uncharacterized protein YjiS (DUF1127 family)
MSQIDREMEQLERRPRTVTLFSTVGAFATPGHAAHAARPLREAWLSRTWRALSAALEHAADAIWTWHDRAKTRRQLMMLDDRLLKDMGITRLQAQAEAEKPFWRV